MAKPVHPRVQQDTHQLYCQRPSGAGGYEAWSVGANVLSIFREIEVPTQTGVVVPRCPSMTIDCALEVGGEVNPVMALLDTGASWSLLSADFATQIGLDPEGGELLDKPIMHGNNEISGYIQHVDLLLKAAEGWGQDLRIPARFVISYQWVAPSVVLGVRGCLELLRVGVEVGATPDAVPRWYFGRAV
jgi:hypothetical protein